MNKTAGVIVNVLRMNNGVAEFLYLRRSGGDYQSQWWPVAGHCERDESVIDTVIRELKEETCLTPLSIYNLDMAIPHVDRTSILEGFVVFVDSLSQVHLNYEHDAYRWLDFKAVLQLVPTPVHPVIKHIYSYFILQPPSHPSLIGKKTNTPTCL